MGNILNVLSTAYHQLTFHAQALPASIQLSGQTALVTGSNTGLGLAAASELAQHGLARLILGVRDATKGSEAAAAIRRAAPACDVQVWELDQASWASTTAFARRARADLDRLDYVLLNAGLKRLQWSTTPPPTEHEAHVQVNYLTTAALSLLLLEPLRETAARTGRPGRMTFTSSSVAFWAPVADLRRRPEEEGGMLGWLDNPASFVPGESRYCLSKLLGLLWMRELAARVDGAEVVINALNPGFCKSEFHRVDPRADWQSEWLAFTTAEGGYHLTDAVVRHPGSHGAYLSEQKIRPVSKFMISAEGQEAQKKLWKETLEVFQKECPDANLDEFRK
ncbi:NAD(P)-binding protein [Whalleya microplaca]|nr:NAD(P)-binding protein [Whalleya microplaca]